MEFNIKHDITPDDLLQGISWHGETNHDDEAASKLRDLNSFISDLIAKICFFQFNMEEIATNQNNISAGILSEESRKLLINVVKMATKEENWDKIDELFK